MGPCPGVVGGPPQALELVARRGPCCSSSRSRTRPESSLSANTRSLQRYFQRENASVYIERLAHMSLGLRSRIRCRRLQS